MGRKIRNKYKIFIRRGKLTRKDMRNLEKIILKHLKPRQIGFYGFKSEFESIRRYRVKPLFWAYKGWKTLSPATSIKITPLFVEIEAYPLYYTKTSESAVMKTASEIGKYCGKSKPRLINEGERGYLLFGREM